MISPAFSSAGSKNPVLGQKTTYLFEVFMITALPLLFASSNTASSWFSSGSMSKISVTLETK